MKVTIDTIKHPENPGARRRAKSVMQMYPSLPPTVEVTEEDSTSKTLEWVNNSNERATKDDAKVTMSMSPPDYEQSEKTRKNIIHNGHPGGADRHPSRDVYQPAPPTYDIMT